MLGGARGCIPSSGCAVLAGVNLRPSTWDVGWGWAWTPNKVVSDKVRWGFAWRRSRWGTLYNGSMK